MKINVIESPDINEVVIDIRCSKVDETIDNLVRSLKLQDLKIIGIKRDKTYFLNSEDVMYFESVDEKIFCYTMDEVYETKYRLYELESLLSYMFVRVSKTTVLNINKIKSFKTILSGRVECQLKNNEKVLVSRMYVKQLKSKLGL